MFFNNAFHGTQTQSRPLAFFFGGKEVLEDFRKNFFGDAASGIAELDIDLSLRFIPAAAYGDISLAGNCVGSVYYDIGENLYQLFLSPSHINIEEENSLLIVIFWRRAWCPRKARVCSITSFILKSSRFISVCLE